MIPADPQGLIGHRVQLTVLPEGYSAPRTESQLVEAVADDGVYVHDGYHPLPKGRNKDKFKNLHFIPWDDVRNIVIEGGEP